MKSREARAVILAAGRGRRMEGLTADRPKCLLEAGGMTLLDWQLKALRRAGLRRIAAVVGYRAEMLGRSGLFLFENPEWACSNTLSSLLAAGPWLEKSVCVVSYGDIAYHPEIIASLLAHPADLVIPYDVLWRELWQQRFARPETDAESFRVRDGWLTEIGERGVPLDSIQGQFTGLIKISPKGWSLVRRWADALSVHDRMRLDTTGALSRLLSKGVAVAALPIRGRWCEMDSEQDLRLCREKFSEGNAWPHDWRF